MNIKENIEEIRQKIEKARRASPIAAKSVILLAASKNQPMEAIIQAAEAGIRDFGENRVQMTDKRLQMTDNRWHLIGALQSNKAKQALEIFDVIQSLDRKSLADEIVGIRDSGLGIRVKEFYIQVNTGEEPQKSGILPKDADDFIEYCRGKLKLPITGLMCVPPANQPPVPHFALLRQIAMRHNLPNLSMGMSGDYEEAIRMGATCVRVGTALFGGRV